MCEPTAPRHHFPERQKSSDLHDAPFPLQRKAVFCSSGIKRGTAQRFLGKHFFRGKALSSVLLPSLPPLNTHLCPPCVLGCQNISANEAVWPEATLTPIPILLSLTLAAHTEHRAGLHPAGNKGQKAGNPGYGTALMSPGLWERPRIGAGWLRGCWCGSSVSSPVLW